VRLAKAYRSDGVVTGDAAFYVWRRYEAGADEFHHRGGD
jgi:hypothetical protein